MTLTAVSIADLGIVIAAGGSGCRYGGGNKLFELLNGRPVFTYALNSFVALCRPEALIMVVPEGDRDEFSRLIRQYCPSVRCRLVNGGKTRGQSVCNGLAALPARTAWVAVHDAARPLATAELLRRCLDDARIYGGAVVGRPVTDTLKCSEDGQTIAATVDRSRLWAVETPQIFALPQLLTAYEKAGTQEFTDDAGVMEAAGYQVALTVNTSFNPKITFRYDLQLAAAMMQTGEAASPDHQ